MRGIAADDLIASLRSDLASLRRDAKEATELRDRTSALQAKHDEVLAERRALSNTLADAQGEIRMLHAKLASSRVSPDASKQAQGLRAGTGALAGVAIASDAQKRVLKEELYSDLTGLIVRDVKRREEQGEDVYDCIQTGRNGSKCNFLSLNKIRRKETGHC